ncbi:MAG: hypothetical protein GX234_10490 [Clostridiales bacterium]|nr:hypothetical protein [Clostridiales bacterium]
MDFYWNGNTNRNNMGRQRMYSPVYGVITQIQDMRMGSSRNSGCTKLITLETEDGNPVNFVVSPSTYILDQVTFYESQPVVMFYDPMAPMPLIYPPQYRAVVAGENVPDVNVTAGYFDRNLLNADGSLRLNLSPQTVVVTSNNQNYTGNPGGRDLVVVYQETTRSIPAQTTPVKVVVLCGCGS